MKHFGGGLSHSEIWELPIGLRKFYTEMMVAEIKKENDKILEAQKNTKKTPKIPKMPNFRNIRK
tara:strand:- start:4970 stop:5161 length:192 start_codon:yes stop_codon:yes gene_type:complete